MFENTITLVTKCCILLKTAIFYNFLSLTCFLEFWIVLSVSIIVSYDIVAAVFFKPVTNEQCIRPQRTTMITTGNNTGNVCCMFLTLRYPASKIRDESYEKGSGFVTLWHAKIDVIPNTKYCCCWDKKILLIMSEHIVLAQYVPFPIIYNTGCTCFS